MHALWLQLPAHTAWFPAWQPRLGQRPEVAWSEAAAAAPVKRTLRIQQDCLVQAGCHLRRSMMYMCAGHVRVMHADGPHPHHKQRLFHAMYNSLLFLAHTGTLRDSGESNYRLECCTLHLVCGSHLLNLRAVAPCKQAQGYQYEQTIIVLLLCPVQERQRSRRAEMRTMPCLPLQQALAPRPHLARQGCSSARLRWQLCRHCVQPWGPSSALTWESCCGCSCSSG